MPYDGLTRIDASTFQEQLLSLAETIALKLDREGKEHLSSPPYVAQDLFVLIRYAKHAFAFISYMNADERRNHDIYWREQYSVIGLTAIRSLIDCLYNITAILENPSINGKRFRCSGIKKFQLNLEEDERRYSDRPEWNNHITMRRQLLQAICQQTGVDLSEIRIAPTWKTLGSCLRESFGNDTPIQAFLRSLTLGAWSDYSALSHASFEGLIPHGLYFIRDVLQHERRPMVKENFLPFITMHICRAAGVLACILTEVQAHCHFDPEGTAKINQRLHEIWDALILSYEVEEFYADRYKAIMETSGIRTSPP